MPDKSQPRPTIADVRLAGLHGCDAVSVKLEPGLNIVHARNGVGKTTLLHALANLADGDVDRFCWIRFETLEVTTSAGTQIELRQRSEREPTEGWRVEIRIDGRTYGAVNGSVPPNSAVRKLLADALGGRPVYLPAFRSILEAVKERRPYGMRSDAQQGIEKLVARELEQSALGQRPFSARHRAKEAAEGVAIKTLMCRDWFGDFVPIIRCPSLTEIRDELGRELADARFEVANTDIAVSGNVFSEVLTAALPAQERDTSADHNAEAKIPALAGQIRQYLSGLPDPYPQLAVGLGQLPDPKNLREQATLARILAVYERALAKRASAGEAAFRRINTFIESVNRFLEDKKLVTDAVPVPGREYVRERIAVETRARRAPLSVLSSGERQVVTLLFSATHMSVGDGVLLVDEPELSLHLVWQRILLRELMALAGERQVVVCTHAPELAADHRAKVRDLAREPWVPTGAQAELELGDEKEAGQ